MNDVRRDVTSSTSGSRCMRISHASHSHTTTRTWTDNDALLKRLQRLKECTAGSHSLTATGRHLPYGITHCSVTCPCHPIQVNAPRLNPSQYAGTRFTYPRGMEGWVDIGYPTMHRPGTEFAISRSRVRRPNHYTTEPSCHQLVMDNWVKWFRLNYFSPIQLAKLLVTK